MSGTRGALFGVALGIALVAAALVWAAVNVRGLAGAERVDGIVTADSQGSARIVEYTAADGKQYTTRTTVSTVLHHYRTGDRVPVAYDPADPAHARLADFTTVYSPSVFIGGFGSLFAAAAGWGYRSARARRHLGAWLDGNGREIWIPARHARVQITARDSSTGRPTRFSVNVYWVDKPTGRTYTADSDPLDTDPTPLLAAGHPVRVLYDPANPTRNRLALQPEPHEH